MGSPVAGASDGPGGVLRCFAEFSMLPRLLADVSRLPQWGGILEAAGCNLDHVEDEDIPGGRPALFEHMADDAWSLVEGLELVEIVRTDGQGRPLAARLTEHGERFMEAARGEAGGDAMGSARSVLAQQLRDCCRGAGDADIPEILLAGAGALSETAHVWAGYCPGLLLVELDALICEACADADEAWQLAGSLVRNRDQAMHRRDMPSPDVEPAWNLHTHADSVADLYLETLGYGDRSDMLMTGLRATAMLFTWTGLLEEGAPMGPVQYLTPPRR